MTLYLAGDRNRDNVIRHKGSCWQTITDRCENDNELLSSASNDVLTWIASLKSLSPNITLCLKGR
jgi:hypothetical protein